MVKQFETFYGVFWANILLLANDNCGEVPGGDWAEIFRSNRTSGRPITWWHLLRAMLRIVR